MMDRRHLEEAHSVGKLEVAYLKHYGCGLADIDEAANHDDKGVTEEECTSHDHTAEEKGACVAHKHYCGVEVLYKESCENAENDGGCEVEGSVYSLCRKESGDTEEYGNDNADA